MIKLKSLFRRGQGSKYSKDSSKLQYDAASSNSNYSLNTEGETHDYQESSSKTDLRESENSNNPITKPQRNKSNQSESNSLGPNNNIVNLNQDFQVNYDHSQSEDVKNSEVGFGLQMYNIL